MATLFISDLHLDRERPETIDLFVEFTRSVAPPGTTLYVLGDLFEAWIGDDEDDPELLRVKGALGELAARGVACFVMHGNRDFLIGRRFAEDTGCELLGDYEIIEVFGTRVLLTHGDLLCTDDTDYQALRRTVRQTDWQAAFLAKPLEERRAIAADMRAKSRSEIAAKAEDIMDVNDTAVMETMRHFRVRHLLHGHTHRPAVHDLEVDGEPAKRIVLGDWHDTGWVVRWTPEGFTLANYPA